jgi:hypothetical protein
MKALCIVSYVLPTMLYGHLQSIASYEARSASVRTAESPPRRSPLASPRAGENGKGQGKAAR